MGPEIEASMTTFYRILAWLLGGVKPVRRPEFDPTVKYGPALTREQQDAINQSEYWRD